MMHGDARGWFPPSRSTKPEPAGIAPIDRLRPCVDAARDLLSEVSTARLTGDGRENARRC